MRFKDRYTQRNCVDNEYIYYSKKDLQDVFRRLGYYEDIGYSPEELADILIDAELSRRGRNGIWIILKNGRI